jgi:multidrug efflux pump subunit AcrA (membrane-fusion protein)
VLAVPRRALVYDEREIPYVFIKQDQHYTQQQVQTGLTADGWVEILTGLEPMDEVVTRGAYELFYRTFSHTFKVAD